MNGGLVTNWEARRAEQFPHLGNYTLTPGPRIGKRRGTEKRREYRK